MAYGPPSRLQTTLSTCLCTVIFSTAVYIEGEKYIRNKVCSEHMFGKKLNFGKHIFGTWMFGT